MNRMESVQMTLWPNEIRFSHNSMGALFSDGIHVASTFRDLLFGHLEIAAIPPIDVYTIGGNYYAVTGNKRLRIYKQLHSDGTLARPINVILMRCLNERVGNIFTTKNNGTYIEHTERLNNEFRKITDAWRQLSNAFKPPDGNIRLSPFPALNVLNLIQRSGYDKSLKHRQHFVNSLLPVRRRDQIIEIEYASRGYNNIFWHQYRFGRISSNHFGKVLLCLEKGLPPNRDLIALLLGVHGVKNMKALEWSKDHENDAINFYEVQTQQLVHPCGIYISRNGLFGASPDGAVNSRTIVQIKSPFALRNKRISQQLAEGEYFVCSDDHGDYVLNINNPIGKDYYNQIQGTLYISGAKQCDLIVWTPHEQTIIHVAKNPEWKENIPRLREFYMDRYLPRLFDKSRAAYQRKNVVFNDGPVYQKMQ